MAEGGTGSPVTVALMDEMKVSNKVIWVSRFEVAHWGGAKTRLSASERRDKAGSKSHL